MTYLEKPLAKTDQATPPTNAEELEDESEHTTITTITQALGELDPRASKSPYNKRWWTGELLGLRDEYTTRRNRVTTLRRRGEETEKAGKWRTQRGRRSTMRSTDKIETTGKTFSIIPRTSGRQPDVLKREKAQRRCPNLFQEKKGQRQTREKLRS